MPFEKPDWFLSVLADLEAAKLYAVDFDPVDDDDELTCANCDSSAYRSQLGYQCSNQECGYLDRR